MAESEFVCENVSLGEKQVVAEEEKGEALEKLEKDK